ncbi:cupin domain-containing protein [Goodfellowiella coeruleoviolacea]|uniref:Cupin domain-containing protein n=1 Tax=Goodfellowiella coeruleoviolacea TaxID=334858 RepID=A0AAE3KJ51_9PSEU|nr:cupin domain-containing protein [Goodfellowiella coeruleoviolacea]MCP2169911.1 Cupin domain-containing protein [Goodfellowiella coeruleoviolacea]
MTTTDLNGQAAVLVRAGQAERLTDGPGSLITLFADSDSTGGVLTSNRATLGREAAGTPVHFHTRATEFFFVLDGALQVLAGEQLLTLHQGDFLTVPPRLPHAFAPAPGATADVLVLFSPGMARFDYYRLLDRVNRGEASPAEIAASSERYDNHYVDSPIWREARAAG